MVGGLWKSLQTAHLGAHLATFWMEKEQDETPSEGPPYSRNLERINA